MSKSIDICLDLNSVNVAKVQALICYPSYLSCLCLILEQGATMSDADLPGEVQRYINVYLSLNSADSDLVKKLIEFLRNQLCQRVQEVGQLVPVSVGLPNLATLCLLGRI